MSRTFCAKVKWRVVSRWAAKVCERWSGLEWWLQRRTCRGTRKSRYAYVVMPGHRSRRMRGGGEGRGVESGWHLTKLREEERQGSGISGLSSVSQPVPWAA